MVTEMFQNFAQLFSPKIKKLYIVRGVPGAGKSDFATSICKRVTSADDYFMKGGEYRFDATRLHTAHRYCQNKTDQYMKAGYDVAVANTFTRKREMKEYYALAEKYGYRVYSIIVENRHGGENVHNVPEETIEKMIHRFQVVL